jgi:hypothetical protein
MVMSLLMTRCEMLFVNSSAALLPITAQRESGVIRREPGRQRLFTDGGSVSLLRQ